MPSADIKWSIIKHNEGEKIMKITSINDYTTLNNKIKMPWLGFGVFQTKEGEERAKLGIPWTR